MTTASKMSAPIRATSNPLTPNTFSELMRDRPAWDVSHPKYSLYRSPIQHGFALIYPGSTRYVDEFTFRLNDGDVKRHTLERLVKLVTASFRALHNLQGVDYMTAVLAVLNAVTNELLTYRPHQKNPKFKKAKENARSKGRKL